MLKRPCVHLLMLLSTVFISALNSPVEAAEPPSAVGSMLKLLKSGRVPEQRLGTIVKLICDRGNEHDLKFVFDQIVEPDHWSMELRSSALQQLSDASTTRKIKPAGDLAEIVKLFDSDQKEIHKTAIQLAGQWNVSSAFNSLKSIATNAGTSFEVQTSALLSMARIAPDKAKSLLSKFAQAGHSFHKRSTAIRVLSRIDVEAAANLAAKALVDAGERDLPVTILDGFLDREGGSKVLAAAVEVNPPQGDVAKLALRHMYSIGRTDKELSDVLSKIAGIAGDPKPPTKAELAALVVEVNEHGDPARGERVFRRNDLSCMKCHAVSKAGGQIGPDLSAIGASSPLDYVVMSVLDPDQSIKEAYTTRVVVTTAGRIHQGLVADRTANALVLKDATGKQTSIPIGDIEDEVEGKSLMPKGLVKFMTHAEFIDLAKFISMLGKPGDYAIRTTQRMQRWRLLADPPQELIDEVPTLSSFEDLVLRSKSWLPVYAKVNGELPLEEMITRNSQPVVYLQGELNVSKSGMIQGTLNSAQGVQLWLDDEQLEPGETFEKNLEAGVHAFTLRIDSNARQADAVKLEFNRLDGSKAEFAVVDGN